MDVERREQPGPDAGQHTNPEREKLLAGHRFTFVVAADYRPDRSTPPRRCGGVDDGQRVPDERRYFPHGYCLSRHRSSVGRFYAVRGASSTVRHARLRGQLTIGTGPFRWPESSAIIRRTRLKLLLM